MNSRTTVVNIRKESPGTYTYIGRPSTLGNPFIIGRDGARSDVVLKHLKYFHKRLISDPEFRRSVLALKGKKLGCYCHNWEWHWCKPSILSWR